MTVKEAPITYFEDNLIFDVNGDVRAGFKVPDDHIDYRSEDEQIQISDEWEDFYWNLKDEAHLLMVPRNLELTDHFDKLKGQVVEDLKSFGQEQLDRTLNYLKQPRDGQEGKYFHPDHQVKEKRETFTYDFYVLMKLKKTSAHLENFRDRLKFRFKDLKRQIDNLSGVSLPEIFEEELHNYRVQENMAYQRLRDLFGNCKRMSPDEIAYLIKQAFWRGIADPPQLTGYRIQAVPDERDGEPIRRPKKSDILRLTGGMQDDQHGRRLRVKQYVSGKKKGKGAYKVGYQCFLVLSHIPDDRPVPGTNWVNWLQSLPFPVALSKRVVPVHYRKALSRVRNKKKELGDQESHIHSAGGSVPRYLQDAIDGTEELEGDLVQDRFPLLETSVTICVYADTPEELERRISEVTDLYEDHVFQVDIPHGQQFQLFQEFLPGSPILVKDYMQSLDPTMLAGSFFGSTRSLGDRDGIFMGESDHLDVFCDFTRGPRDEELSQSPAVCFVGPPGQGKSMAADYIVANLVYLDIQVVVIDPKNDRGHWPDIFPEEFSRHIRVVTLTANKEDRGKLDPLTSSGKDGANTAKKILQTLANVPDGSYVATAISEAVEDTLEDETAPNMIQVLKRLRTHYEQQVKTDADTTQETREDFKQKLYTLEHHSQRGQGQLLFSDGSGESINLSNRLTILQIQDLDLPEEGQSEGGRLGVALMVALSDFARAFANQPSKKFKVVLYDEAWRMRKTREGRNALKELILTGRSKNSALFIVSQNAVHLKMADSQQEDGDEIQNNLGMRFIFRPGTGKEAERACDLLNIEPTDENIRSLQKLRAGEFFLYDWEGRVNKVSLPLKKMNPELFRILDTRPNQREALLRELEQKKQGKEPEMPEVEVVS